MFPQEPGSFRDVIQVCPAIPVYGFCKVDELHDAVIGYSDVCSRCTLAVLHPRAQMRYLVIRCNHRFLLLHAFLFQLFFAYCTYGVFGLCSQKFFVRISVSESPVKLIIYGLFLCIERSVKIRAYPALRTLVFAAPGKHQRPDEKPVVSASEYSLHRFQEARRTQLICVELFCFPACADHEQLVARSCHGNIQESQFLSV